MKKKSTPKRKDAKVTFYPGRVTFMVAVVSALTLLLVTVLGNM